MNSLKESDLAQFTGTEHWYRHGLVRRILYTDGARHVAEAGGAYWLLDAIAFAQVAHREVAAEPFQLWTLTVAADSSAFLTCQDGNGRCYHTQRIAFTDFPLPKIALYFTNNTILLPSEY